MRKEAYNGTGNITIMGKVANEETAKCKCCGRDLPVVNFKSNPRYGRASVCNECVKKKYAASRFKKSELNILREQLENARKLRLSDFTPRELLAELKSRGYKWDKMSVTMDIDYNKI